MQGALRTEKQQGQALAAYKVFHDVFRPLDDVGTIHDRVVKMAIYLRHHGADYQTSHDMIQGWYESQSVALVGSTGEGVPRDIREVVSWAQKRPAKNSDGLVVFSRQEMLHIMAHATRAERLVLFMLYVRAKAGITFSHERMVQSIGLCRQTISETLRKLAADGEIKVRPGKARKTRKGYFCRECCVYEVVKKSCDEGTASAWPASRQYTALDVKYIEHDFMIIYGRAICRTFGKLDLRGRLYKQELAAYEAAVRDDSGNEMNTEQHDEGMSFSSGCLVPNTTNAVSDVDIQMINNEEETYMSKGVQNTEVQAGIGMQVFSNSAFGELSVLMIDGKPYFSATECANTLGYVDPHGATAKHCRYPLKRRVPHPQSTGKVIEKTFIPEGDLYRLIVKSKLPAAQEFERFVFDEVLPSIRRHGVYATAETAERLMNDPDFMIKTFQTLKEERSQRIALEKQVEADKPKVLFAERVEQCKDTVKIRDLALILNQNGIGVGQRRMFERLREDGFLCASRDDRWNMPTQKAMDLGLFRVHERFIMNRYGNEQLVRTTHVTGKGQVYLIDFYLRRQVAQ